jgi:cytoskeletal protein CcmA (bactofilin family)
LFGSAKKTTDTLGYGKVETIIGEGTEIRGTIQSTGVVRLDGYMEGTVEHKGDLIIGPKGRINATIKTQGLAVAGEVRGDIDVEGKLELLPGARLYGDIRCGHLVVHQGAMFHGHSRMNDEPPKTSTNALLTTTPQPQSQQPQPQTKGEKDSGKRNRPT